MSQAVSRVEIRQEADPLRIEGREFRVYEILVDGSERTGPFKGRALYEIAGAVEGWYMNMPIRVIWINGSVTDAHGNPLIMPTENP